MTHPRLRLPAEWEDQDAILLTWPHAATDWAPILGDAERVFRDLAAAIVRFTRLVVVCHDDAVYAHVAATLATMGLDPRRFRLLGAPCDDTWARDHGPITVVDGDGAARVLSFRFRGWGGKFAAARDDAICGALGAQGLFAHPITELAHELEGGAIESDGRGTILTTRACVLHSNRNHGGWSQAEAEAVFAATLGASRVLWLAHGALQGDDTDSHIDTLARFAPGADGRGETIVYVACDDMGDDHHADLAAMAAELAALRTDDGRPYQLAPLPWPRAAYDDDGQRLPATYANYLVIDGAVLVPTYDDPADAAALDIIAAAHPGRAVVGIDCRPLIVQHGSLHCVTMQLPRGALAPWEER